MDEKSTGKGIEILEQFCSACDGLMIDLLLSFLTLY